MLVKFSWQANFSDYARNRSCVSEDLNDATIRSLISVLLWQGVGCPVNQNRGHIFRLEILNALIWKLLVARVYSLYEGFWNFFPKALVNRNRIYWIPFRISKMSTFTQSNFLQSVSSKKQFLFHFPVILYSLLFLV